MNISIDYSALLASALGVVNFGGTREFSQASRITPDDFLPLRIERQGTNVVVYYDGYFRLEEAPTVRGPWTTIDSPSPVVEALSSVPVRYFRVVNR